jgi:hypothetical protein
VSALGHYLEDEGIATTGISLVREHTEGYRPPRFLWVPFPLGRPFGAPGEATFQRAVLQAALALLERDDGPVILEDFPDEAPPACSVDEAEWVCPVSFGRAPVADDPVAAVLQELAALAPWYALGLERRGRTLFGMCGVEAPAVVRYIGAFLAGTPAPLRADLGDAENLKLATEDLKAYYLEAAIAQPGEMDAHAGTRWFWKDTRAGALLLAIHAVLLRHGQADLQRLAQKSFVPRVAREP